MKIVVNSFFPQARLLGVIKCAEDLTSTKNKIKNLHTFVSGVNIEFIISSSDLSLKTLQEIIRETLHEFTNLTNKGLSNFEIVLEETVLNAHEHGNLELESEWKNIYPEGESISLFEKTKEERLNLPEFARRELKIQLTIDTSKVELAVQDRGNGFQTGKIRSEVTGDPFGMGSTIVNNLMDEIRFNDKRNRITLAKHLNGKTPNQR